MTRRKSLARRTPAIIYLLCVKEGANESYFKGWEEDDYGRINRSECFGIARVENDLSEYMKVRDHYVSSKDTDAIHQLPELVRHLLWQFDDAIRAANK